jgi:hypothetical protein
MEKTIELLTGYTDAKGVTHRSVTFGRRLRGRDLFALDSDPQAAVPTQHGDLICAKSITAFGALTMPVSLSVLLDLDSLDRDDLAAAYNEFQMASAEGREAEFLSDSTVRPAFGFEREGLRYDVVEFGHRLTGRDEVAADKERLDGAQRRCFLAGRQIAQLRQSDGTATIDGPIPLSWFEALDAADIWTLLGAAEIYRQSFRRHGNGLQKQMGASG